MRVTIHLVSREDFWPFALATREPRRALWLRTRPEPATSAAMSGAARSVRRRLAGGGELTRKELEALVGRERTAGVGLWVDLVRAPPSGTWERRRADRFALAEDWIGPAPGLSAAEAGAHLVARYLAAFGPASRHDVAGFTGLALRPLDRLLAGMELERFRSEEGEDLLDVPGGLLPDGDAPAPPRFLPTWDATLLVHARRTGVLPEVYRPRLFGIRTPASFPSFLVDGAVAGTWRYEDGEVRLEPFAPLSQGRCGRARGGGRAARRVPRLSRAAAACDLGAHGGRHLRAEQLDRAHDVAVGQVAHAHLHQEPLVAEDLVLEQDLLDHLLRAADQRARRAARAARRTARGSCPASRARARSGSSSRRRRGSSARPPPATCARRTRAS